MPLTDAGRDLIALAIRGESYTAYNNANSYLGVGDNNSVTTDNFNKNQTDLVTSDTDKKKMGMVATWPQQGASANIIQFKSLFGVDDANFAWNEWGVFNGGTAFATGTMLCRKVEQGAVLGTKTNAASWQLTVDITVNNP